MKLFSDTLPFLKCNFHAHTTESDGQRTPDEVMALYRAAGYDVLALTDHRRVTVPDENAIPEGLLMVPGIELDYMLPGQACHIIGLGMSGQVTEVWDPKGAPQSGIDAIRQCGGEALLAHPAWSLNTPRFIASLEGIIGAEIWNSVSTIPYNADRADSSSLLDVTSAVLGRLLPVFANDDAHFYGAEFAAGATMVQAAEKTVPAVMQALREGRFYATQGPQIHQLEVTKKQVKVVCSPAETIIFYSALPWSAGRTFVAHDQTEVTYALKEGERFIRVQVIDANGKSAWSAPMKV